MRGENTMTTNRNSRISGFYKLSLDKRREVAAKALGISSADLVSALEFGGLHEHRADKTVENVVGTYSLPFGMGLNVRINGRDHFAPMVVEEPSVIAAASNASRLIREGGGFVAETDDPLMISQIQFDEVKDGPAALERVHDAKQEILRLADEAVPGLVRRGGGAREVEVRDLGDGMVVVHVLVDCQKAMGANLVNTVAEHLAPRLAELTGGRIGLRILSNLSDRRRVRVQATIPKDALASDGFSGEEVCEGVVRASRFAEKDPYRAATHNKGIFNGVDAVVIATGNDWRAVEAGAHAYAARNGRYEPLCVWTRDMNGDLQGFLEMPLALGTVGGPTRVHDGARLGLQMAGVEGPEELAMLVGAVGMASNLAALKALATAGIQRGHMALHARSVAIAAGAQGALVERVAQAIHAGGQVTLEHAARVLAEIRDSVTAQTQPSSLAS